MSRLSAVPLAEKEKNRKEKKIKGKETKSKVKDKQINKKILFFFFFKMTKKAKNWQILFRVFKIEEKEFMCVRNTEMFSPLNMSALFIIPKNTPSQS